jgi:glycogen operon protein
MGLRYNPNKVLVDPYAKSVLRQTRWHESMYGCRRKPAYTAVHLCIP